jgi:hypothetical protein
MILPLGSKGGSASVIATAGYKDHSATQDCSEVVQRRLFEVACFIQCLNCSKGIAQLTLDEML